MGGVEKVGRKKGPVPRENINNETKQNERQKKKVQKTFEYETKMEKR